MTTRLYTNHCVIKYKKYLHVKKYGVHLPTVKNGKQALNN